LPRLKALDQPRRRGLPLPADEVRLANGRLDSFPDFAEVEIDFLRRCAGGWPWPGLLDLVEVVLGQGADRTIGQSSLAADRIEEEFAHRIQARLLDRPALGDVELEPQLSGCVTGANRLEVAEIGPELLEVRYVVPLPGVGESTVRINCLDFRGERPVEHAPQHVGFLDVVPEHLDSRVGSRVHGDYPLV
jgi:hypothetical protein